MSHSKSSNRIGTGCMALFGLPFAAVSAYTGWMLVSMLWLSLEAKSWEVVPAKINEVELQESRNDGSSTYQVLANYEYRFQGRKYESDKVGLSSWKDNVGSYHRDLYERLKKAKDEGVTIDCFVDKNHPDRSLLDRTLRPVMVAFMLPFVLGFGVAGFGLIGGSIYASRQLAAADKLEEANPEKPWLWREDWQRGTIASSSKSKLVYTGLFAFFWCVVTFPIAFIMLSDGQEHPWWGVLLAMIFPTIGLGIISHFVLLLWRSRKFGVSTFRLANSHGLIGGKLKGVVMAPDIVNQAKLFQAKLVCLKRVKSGDKTREKIIWQDSRNLSQTLSSDLPGRVGIPIVFTVPSDCSSTSKEEEVSWKLCVEAKTEGVNYDEEFEVPVFRTADSKEDVVIEDEPLSPYETALPLNEQLTEQGILVESLGVTNGVRYVSPIGRHLGATLGLTVFAMAWLGSILFMFSQGIWFFFAIFSLFGLLIFYLTIDNWLGCSELVIIDDKWKVRSGWYGFRRAAVEFSSSDIRKIYSRRKSSSGGGTKQTTWKNMRAELDDGTEVMLVRYVLSGTSERQFLTELHRRAGISAEGRRQEKTGESDLWDYVN